MPKDNEVDEKAVAFAADDGNGGILWGKGWMFARTKGRQAVIPLYSAATVAELRAEVERWKSRYDDAMQARADEQKRADAAERRVGELTSLLSDTVGNLHRMGNNEFADCDQERLDIVIRRIERTLTGADPT